MNSLGSIIEELRTRAKTRKLNSAFLRSEFHRKCIEHYTNNVFPQLELFETHLTAQRLFVTFERLYQLDENVLLASLVVKFGIVVRFLQFRYDYRSKDLSFVQTNGPDRADIICSESYVNFEKLTSVQVYDIIADFMKSIASTIPSSEF